MPRITAANMITIIAVNSSTNSGPRPQRAEKSTDRTKSAESDASCLTVFRSSWYHPRMHVYASDTHFLVLVSRSSIVLSKLFSLSTGSGDGLSASCPGGPAGGTYDDAR